MGEVFRARDTRLDRDVAIKILRPLFADDPERLVRFEREAHVLASLNHANIAHIYGIEDAPAIGVAGTAGKALVMELVDGEDLSAHIARGPLALAEAVAIARQIADALACAHEHGIVHRDLKPANVKIRPDATVKVLDFGLAKLADTSAGPSSSASSSPTITSPATQLGVILGTAAYMSPEQARGEAVDRRADVWAFGVIVFEMLTGSSPFRRGQVSDTLAAVLTHEPDLHALPAATPETLRRLLRHCLEKDVRRRHDSMTAVRFALDDALATPESAPPAATRRWVPYALAAVMLAAGFAGGALLTRGAATVTTAGDAAPVVALIGAPPGVISAFHDGFALSPDERRLAFTARDATGLRKVWIRPLDSLEARPLAGTDGGHHPFWSPDGSHVAFFADYHLRRVALVGGPPQMICRVREFFPAGSWNERDEILYGTGEGNRSMVFKVPAAGGTPQQIQLQPPGLRPYWLAARDEFLYTAPGDEAGLYVVGSGGGAATRLLSRPPESTGVFVYSPNYIFANRSGALTVQRFDLATRRPEGSPVALAGYVGTPNTWFALSAAGESLVALARMSPGERGDPGDPLARLRWVDRQGRQMSDASAPEGFWAMRLSPDGRRIIANPDLHVWLFEGSRQIPLTSGEQSYGAIWSPDGREMVFMRRARIFRKAVQQDAPEEILPNVSGTPTDWSGAGTLAVTTKAAPEGRGFDIVFYDLNARTARPWLATEFDEKLARISPDGRWVAYVSNASGREEVYLRAVIGAGAPLLVSSEGGTHPVWRRDGRELFYLAPQDDIMAVDVTLNAGAAQAGEPRRLFRVPLNNVTRPTQPPYDVTPDGQRFLLNVPDAPRPLLYIRGIKRLLGR